MVLPGIQAIFGFQLIAVFNQGFSEKLTSTGQLLHLFSVVLTVISIALVMAPAALHRQTDPFSVTDRFIRTASRLLLFSMFPFAISICLEVYLIGQIIFPGAIAVVIALALFAVLLGLWFGLPLAKRSRRGTS